REWRAWQAKDNAIEAIEKAERRLQIQHKAKRALTLARLWGGGMLVLGIKGDADTLQPLRPVQKDGLAFVHVLSRHQVTIGDQITDIASPWYGEPEYY